MPQMAEFSFNRKSEKNRTMNTIFQKCIFSLSIFCLFTFSSGSEINSMLNQVKALPEYYFEQDARWFMNHKNDEFVKAYLLEATTLFEAMFVSYADKFFLGGFYLNNLGMGKQYKDIVFDPRDVHYALSPFFEFRHKGGHYQLGLDHRCFHEVDRNSRSTPYWNQLFLRFASENHRRRFMIEKLKKEGNWEYWDRISWSVYVGFFINEFFGWVNPAILSGGHEWQTAGRFETSYDFFKTSFWILNAGHELEFFSNTEGNFYWSGKLSLEAVLYPYRHGISFFVDYNYEFPKERPIYSKDQLFELGMKFSY